MCRAIDAVATGLRIRELCKMKQLTVSEIQKALGLTDDRSVYYWYQGRYLPSLDNLYLLAQILGCTIDDILVPMKPPAENQKEACCKDEDSTIEENFMDNFSDDSPYTSSAGNNC